MEIGLEWFCHNLMTESGTFVVVVYLFFNLSSNSNDKLLLDEDGRDAFGFDCGGCETST